jgi:hypothetical protein
MPKEINIFDAVERGAARHGIPRLQLWQDAAKALIEKSLPIAKVLEPTTPADIESWLFGFAPVLIATTTLTVAAERESSSTSSFVKLILKGGYGGRTNYGEDHGPAPRDIAMQIARCSRVFRGSLRKERPEAHTAQH